MVLQNAHAGNGDICNSCTPLLHSTPALFVVGMAGKKLSCREHILVVYFIHDPRGGKQARAARVECN